MRRRRRGWAHSIRCSPSPCRTPASRMPAIRSSCASSTWTATAMAPSIETVDVRVTAPATGDAEVLRLVGDRPEHRRVRRLHRDRRRTRPRPIARCRSSAMPRSTPPTSIRPTLPTRPRPTRWSIPSVWYSIPRPARRSTARACASSTTPPACRRRCSATTASAAIPSEMVTGQLVTDQGGTQYSLPAGVFRFPLVAPGNYRLEVLPPAQPRIPLAAHDRRSADAAGRAVSACSRVRSASLSWSPRRRRSRSTCRSIPPASRCCCARRAGQQIATTGDFVQYTLTLAERERDRRVHQRAGGRPAAGRRALSARARCA